MFPSIVVVIQENPLKTHRAVEALRIALGLSTGGNPLSIVLLGEAPLLLTEDTDLVVDAEILEKYLPSLRQLGTPFVVPPGSGSRFQCDPDFHVQ
jgi:sulfur relay (sulfurtransferase) DsrF/TusC family protein